jgi:F0F1-type ATP synthase assembly protein I
MPKISHKIVDFPRIKLPTQKEAVQITDYNSRDSAVAVGFVVASLSGMLVGLFMGWMIWH